MEEQKVTHTPSIVLKKGIKNKYSWKIRFTL